MDRDPSPNSDDTEVRMKPPPRPYSEYNVYFQLERNYILQKVYAVPPEATDVFHPEDPEYQGPPLPKRYADVVLPRRFYSCYKSEAKERRRHRTTHGKIGFSELSKLIASNWKNAGETLRCCTKN